MPFGVVSGVVPSIGMLDGGPHPASERKVLGVFLSIALNGVLEL